MSQTHGAHPVGPTEPSIALQAAVITLRTFTDLPWDKIASKTGVEESVARQVGQRAYDAAGSGGFHALMATLDRKDERGNRVPKRALEVDGTTEHGRLQRPDPLGPRESINQHLAGLRHSNLDDFASTVVEISDEEVVNDEGDDSDEHYNDEDDVNDSDVDDVLGGNPKYHRDALVTEVSRTYSSALKFIWRSMPDASTLCMPWQFPCLAFPAVFMLLTMSLHAVSVEAHTFFEITITHDHLIGTKPDHHIIPFQYAC